MLSRTADHLFWMSRYMERAENTARMLDVNYQTSLLPQSADRASEGWDGILGISELTQDFQKKHDQVNARNVMQFMVRDAGNYSSIVSCLSAARENARAVRGTLTTELWETTNQTWLEFQRMLQGGSFERDPAALFEWVKFRSHLSRGVAVGTMLQDEALHFVRIGTFLERADNTARLLDVKFHAVESDFYGAADARDQEYDFYHWSAILRSVSGFEVYRKVYRNVIQPEKVAELKERLAKLESEMAKPLWPALVEGSVAIDHTLAEPLELPVTESPTFFGMVLAEELTKATQLDPQFVEAWLQLGNTLVESGKPCDAKDAYSSCIEADANNILCRNNIINAEKKCKLQDKALTDVKERAAGQKTPEQALGDAQAAWEKTLAG